jgi:glutamyl-tRNA reductase
MLHGALAELHAADGEHRTQLAQILSRLFLRNAPRNPGDEQR